MVAVQWELAAWPARLVFEQSTSIDGCDTGPGATEETERPLFEKSEVSIALALKGSVIAPMAKKITAASTNPCRHPHCPQALGTFNNTRLRNGSL